MPFAVIIPSRTRENLLACIASVYAHESPSRIIVVDDGVNWQNVEIFRPQHEGELTVIPGKKPFVFARNVNLGIREAGDLDVVLLNDDALLQTPGGFTLLEKTSREHPDYGLIAACSTNVGNERQRPQGHFRLTHEPRMACFTCVYIPRSTINQVGFLDEDFTGYGFEDDDYCLRIRRAGLKIGIHDGVYVDHSRELKSTFRGDAYPHAGFAHNAEVFRRKHGASNHEL